MAKESAAKQKNDQNAVRREAKRRQKQARQAAALGQRASKNYRAGFTFALNPERSGGANEVIAHYDRVEEIEERCRKSAIFGQKVNDAIHTWLDLADASGQPVLIKSHDAVTAKAIEELVAWINQHPNRYGSRAEGSAFYIAKVKPTPAKAA